MLDEAAIDDVLGRIDLAALGACPLCLFDLAWAIHSGRPPRAVANELRIATHGVGREIEGPLRVALARLRMRGVEAAGDALADLETHGWRSRVVWRVVERLASAMADEMAQSSIPGPRLVAIPDDEAS
jgi:hypothetical protein